MLFIASKGDSESIACVSMESSGGTSKIATLPGAASDDAAYRLPPVNLEAEQALLGAILANNAAYERVSDFLLPEQAPTSSHDD